MNKLHRTCVVFPSVAASLQKGENRISAQIFIGQLFDKFLVLVFLSQCQDCAQKTPTHSTQHLELEDLSGKKRVNTCRDRRYKDEFIIIFSLKEFEDKPDNGKLSGLLNGKAR